MAYPTDDRVESRDLIAAMLHVLWFAPTPKPERPFLAIATSFRR